MKNTAKCSLLLTEQSSVSAIGKKNWREHRYDIYMYISMIWLMGYIRHSIQVPK